MRNIRKGLAAVATVCLLLTLGGCGVVEEFSHPSVERVSSVEALVAYTDMGYLPSMAPEGMEYICSLGYVSLFADMTTGHFAVEDMRSGQLYYSVPPMAAQDENAYGTYKKRLQSEIWVNDLSTDEGVLKTRNSWESSNEKGGLVIERLENGLRVWYKFMEELYAIPVEYTLCEDGFRATVLMDSIIEQGDRQIYSISVLPYFGAQSGEEGWLLVPDGSGARIHFSSEKQEYAPYTQNLYGSDYLQTPDYMANRQEACYLPMLGVQGADSGFLAIADNGAAYGNVKALADGQYTSYNTAYFDFDTRVKQDALIGNVNAFTNKTVVLYEEGAIGIGSTSVRYCLLESSPETGLKEMAATARAYYAGQEPAVSPLTNALYVSTAGGYRTKTSVLGIRMELTHPLTTFREAEAWLQEVNQAGLSIGMVYENYLSAQLRGKAENNLRVDAAVGSNADLTALLEEAGQGQLFFTVDPLTVEKASWTLSPIKTAVLDMAAMPVQTAAYRRDTWFANANMSKSYLLSLPVATTLLDAFVESLPSAKAGVCLDALGNKLYADYAENGLSKAEMQAGVGDLLGVDGRAYMMNCANDYAAVGAAALINVPGYSSRYDILDEDVPFYQMVFSGSRQLISKPINSYGDIEEEYLNCLRNGMIPHYQWVQAEPSELQNTGLESYFGCSDTYWHDEILTKYEACQSLFRETTGQAIVDYRVLADNVYETVWANGVSVVVNLSTEPYMSEAGQVAARSFVVVA